MKNQIKDTDVLAFVDDLREELGVHHLIVSTCGTDKASFGAYATFNCILKDDGRVDADSIAELKQKLAEKTPEARLAKEIADTEAKLAKLKEKQEGERSRQFWLPRGAMTKLENSIPKSGGNDE